MLDFALEVDEIRIKLEIDGLKETNLPLVNFLAPYISEDYSNMDSALKVVFLEKRRNSLDKKRLSFFKDYFYKTFSKFPSNSLDKKVESALKMVLSYCHHADCRKIIYDSRLEDYLFVPLFGSYLFIYNFKQKEAIVFVTPITKTPLALTMSIIRSIWGLFSLLSIFDSGFVLQNVATIVSKNKSFIFLGESGAGKSTLLSLCPKEYIVSDEVILIKKQEGRYYLNSLPYYEKNFRLFKSTDNLSKIFYLIKDDKTYIEQIFPYEAMSKAIYRHLILREFLRREDLFKVLQLISGLFKDTPLYNLHFEKNREFVKLIK